jgi:acetyl esterase
LRLAAYISVIVMQTHLGTILSFGRSVRYGKETMPKVDIWSRLTPQSQAAVKKSREQYAALKPRVTDALGLARAGYNHERAYWNSFPVALPSVQDLSIDTPAGAVALRLYKPQSGAPLPVLVYVHGGGYILGNLDTHDRICRLLALRSGWAVLAVDYALAPERQFPVQSEQVFAVLQYVAAHGAVLGVDGGRIAIGGDSAGAHLSLAAALDARVANGPAVCAQLLFYGGFGLQDSASRRLYGWADLDGLGDTDTNTYRDHYIADPGDREHARVNLLKSDMAGLPPTFIGAVAYDPLRDDSLVLAEFMKERGVAHRLVVYEGVLHGFMHYSAIEPRALQAIEDGAAFLRELPL